MKDALERHNAMKSFFVRLGSAIGIVAVYLAMYFLRDTVGLEIILSLINLLAVYEFIKATGFEERAYLYPFALVYAASAPFVERPVWLTVAFIIVIFAVALVKFGTADLTHITFIGFMTAFVSLSLSTLVMLRGFDRFEYTLPIILGASVCDVFCYLCGVLLGRHKLCPNVSPQKTVEGALGGIIFTCGAFVLYAYLVDLNMIVMGVLGALVAILSQMGDLTFSAIKRSFGIKDFSNLIPGHGGVMDRVDSWVFAAPAIYIAVSFMSQIGVL